MQTITNVSSAAMAGEMVPFLKNIYREIFRGCLTGCGPHHLAPHNYKKKIGV
jgi:hypothetical protein